MSDTREGPQLLRLAASDNVLVALGSVPAGPARITGGGTLTVGRPVTLGHKVAARDIAPGEKIVKYGVPIGSATAAIASGSHVHTHNMKSDYTPTYVLDETSQGGSGD